MSEEDQQSKHFSKEGIVTIGFVFLLPVLYLLSPPFVVKILQVCGMTITEIGHAVESFYLPLKLLMEAIPSTAQDSLKDYYLFMYEALGVKF